MLYLILLYDIPSLICHFLDGSTVTEKLALVLHRAFKKVHDFRRGLKAQRLISAEVKLSLMTSL